MNQPVSGCPELASIVLTGGEGQRLRALTAAICGTEMFKQFCRVLGTETPLEQPLNRVRLTIPPWRTVTVLTRAHQNFYRPLLGETPPQRLAVQPENRGTTAAIMYGLGKIAAIDPRAIVAIFPSDHYFNDDQRLMCQVAIAARAAWQTPDKLVLLSVSPDGPNISYGSIQLGAIIPTFDSVPIHAVRGFWEKPTSQIARYLHGSGALLNTLVMVAQLRALVRLFQSVKPDLYRAFDAISPTMNTCLEADSVEKVYQSAPSSDFSCDILAKATANLAAFPVTDLEWSDLGEARRVHFARQKLGLDIGNMRHAIKEQVTFRREGSAASGSPIRGGEAPIRMPAPVEVPIASVAWRFPPRRFRRKTRLLRLGVSSARIFQWAR
jgi:mannose-1-phosphate guanylyltransferase